MDKIPTIDRDRLLQVAHESLRAGNYPENLIYRNWHFADIFAHDSPSRTVPLVAFGQDPPSYRSACWAVTIGSSQDIQHLRALGAPQVLQLDTELATRWKVHAEGDPERQDQFAIERMVEVFSEQRDDWGPRTVLRLKGATIDLTPHQLSFYDLGLIPAIDSVVFDKLDRVLRNALGKARAIFSEQHDESLDEQQLVRLVFRFLAAKVFADRGHPEIVIGDDPESALSLSKAIYGSDEALEPMLVDPLTQGVVWHEINSVFNLQNISVEALAHVYENTLVTSQQRHIAGTHATPPAIAEYIVRRLPIESIAERERHFFEPFAGHSVFLIAAMGRLRELLSSDFTPKQRHNYFRQSLTGMESDLFALEVGRLSLILADYPNANSWNLWSDDVFSSPRTQDLIRSSSIVLCNPPFEWLDKSRRSNYGPSMIAHPPGEILNRVLADPPALLGFVLPWSFVEGQSFRDIRRKLVETYGQIEIVGLPDSVFRHSQVEPVLLLAYDKGNTPTILHCAEVQKQDYSQFIRTWEPSWKTETSITPSRAGRALWHHPLDRVFEQLDHLPQLGDIASIHRGIEYRVSFRTHSNELVRTSPSPGFARGLLSVRHGFEPYFSEGHVYLNVDPDLMLYKSYENPWHRPKVIVNAARISRGPWKVSASPDRTGLVCYQRFHGVWPTDVVSVETLSSVLNGPVANAYLSMAKGSRDVTISRLKQIPIPIFSSKLNDQITALVSNYQDLRSKLAPDNWDLQIVKQCEDILAEIDTAVLNAYEFPTPLKLQVLSALEAHPSPSETALRQHSQAPWPLSITKPPVRVSSPGLATATSSKQDSVQSILSKLSSLLGSSIVSSIAGVRESKLDEWLYGNRFPPQAVNERLKVALEIADMLLEEEDQATVRSWFAGKNDMLNDRAPALVLQENSAAVLRAARAFFAYG